MSFPDPEISLLQDCIAGNARAQRGLYDLSCNAMLVVCQRYLPHAEEAREALMDGFLNVFRNLSRFEPRGSGSFRAWQSRIMVNACLMKLRKERMEWDDLAETTEQAAPEGILAKLSAREIMAQVQALPTGYRTVFNLAVFEQMPHAEIAQTLGISESTSKTQLLKARKALQEKLKQHF